MHQGSKETFEFIGDWIDPNFFFSKKDVWHRMGILGMFGDYVLDSVAGDIAEIGCGESSIYLSHLARKYGRKIYHCDIAPDKILNPLTVPGYMVPDPVGDIGYPKTFEHKNSFFFMGPSDDFFAQVNPQKLALSFIDGDHVYAQAERDFQNFADRTVDNGYILLHDTYPPIEAYTAENKCGDVYRLRQDIEKDPRFDCLTLTRGTAMGVGLTICRKKPTDRMFYNE